MEYTWRDDAECLGEDTTVFWKWELEHESAVICDRCPVSDACYQFAIENRISDGIWGGHRFDRHIPRPLTMRQPVRSIISDGRIKVELL